MPIALSHLVADRKPLTIAFAGVGELRVEYFPRKVKGWMLVDYQAALDLMARSTALQRAVAAAAEAGEELDPAMVPDPSDGARATALIVGATGILLPLLAAWDLTAEEGGPTLPITAETLEDLGVAVQWAILSAILTDGSAAGEAAAPGGSTSVPPSGAGSSARGNSARSRTGTRS